MKLLLYILRRIALMLPTLFGITLITFLLVNLAPGGALEQKIQSIRSGGGAKIATRGPQGLSKENIEALKKQYGFDKPIHVRYGMWIKQLVRLDFGKSMDYGQPVMEVITSRFPVSLQFGLASFFLTYLIAVPLGLAMAYFHEKWLDGSLSFGLLIAASLPPFAFGVLLLLFFAGGNFLNLFPLGYLQSDNYETLSLSGKIFDRLHHFVLPLLTYMIGSFTALAFLCRNSVLGEIHKEYIRTARAIGVGPFKVYMRHALRNALIPVVTGIGGFLAVFLTGSLLVEQIFQLNGIGRLGFQALLSRDVNMIMGLAFLQSAALLVGNLVGDLIYMAVDPRIDYVGQG